MNAARALARQPVEVTMIDKRNFHLFQPMLYQVATGSLSPGDITAPLRHVLSGQKNVRVLMAEVTDVDVAGRAVVLDDGGRVPYDTLVVAAGARNFYFGNDAWERVAPALKTIEDATEVRRRIFVAFENAERATDPTARKEWLRFTVVGAGPTGVELAGAIAEIARDTLRHDFRQIRPEEAEILLLDGSTRVLPPFTPDLSEKAERQLIRVGVRARTSVRVTGIDERGVEFTGPHGPERIQCRTTIWAAGVRAEPLGERIARQCGADVDRGGRIPVGADLSVAGHPEILAIGDIAWFEQDGQSLPGMCPVAMQQGWHVGPVVAARVNGQAAPLFRYRNKGTMAVIGRNAAVADLGFARFGGALAWLAWLLVHIAYLIGFRNRLLVLIQWGFQYVSFNRGARLITGRGGN